MYFIDRSWRETLYSLKKWKAICSKAANSCLRPGMLCAAPAAPAHPTAAAHTDDTLAHHEKRPDHITQFCAAQASSD